VLESEGKKREAVRGAIYELRGGSGALWRRGLLLVEIRRYGYHPASLERR